MTVLDAVRQALTDAGVRMSEGLVEKLAAALAPVLEQAQRELDVRERLIEAYELQLLKLEGK